MGIKRNYFVFKQLGFLVLLIVLYSSCEQYFRTTQTDVIAARVGNQTLYTKDIPTFIYQNRSTEDSTALVRDYINKWAIKKLMIDKATLNLPVEQLRDFERLTDNYRSDLYTLAYKEALLNKSRDTTITASELQEFYKAEKDNFKLREKLVRLRFVMVSNQYSDLKIIRNKLINFNYEDQVYLDSISIYFHKINLNDSLWVPQTRVLKEIPSIDDTNSHLYLKKSQFFEIQDSIGVYLGYVKDVLSENEIAPLSFIENDIKTVLINRRKQEFIKTLERDIIDEAIKNREFEIYE